MSRRILAILPLLLASCRTGRGPEGLTADVSLPGVHRLIAADALTRAMLNRGFRVHSLDDKEAVFAKTGDALPAAMLVGSSRANAPESRVRCVLVDEGDGVRIVATLSTVSNAGGRFEHASAPNGGDDLERVRDALAAVKARLARRAAPAARRTPAPAEELEQPAAASLRSDREPEPRAKAEPKTKPEPDSKGAKTKGDWDQDGDDMLEELRRRALSK